MQSILRKQINVIRKFYLIYKVLYRCNNLFRMINCYTHFFSHHISDQSHWNQNNNCRNNNEHDGGDPIFPMPFINKKEVNRAHNNIKRQRAKKSRDKNRQLPEENPSDY